MSSIAAAQNPRTSVNYRHAIVRAVASRNVAVKIAGERLHDQQKVQSPPLTTRNISADPNRKPASPLTSSFWGMVRGAAAQFLFYPIDAVKTRQQAAGKAVTAYEVASSMCSEGVRVFYSGFWYKAGNTAIKQACCWSLIPTLPPHLTNLGPVERQLATGLIVAQVDALVSKHLNNLQIRSIAKGTNVPLRSIWQAGRGYGTYLAHLSVAWSASLSALEFFKQRELKGSERLTPRQTVKVGMSAGLFSSFVSTPFDVANTVKQANGLSWQEFVAKQGWRALFRGAPLRTGMIVTHNVFTAFLLRELV